MILQMKPVDKIGITFILGILFLLVGCRDSVTIPVGHWHSTQGRPSIQIVEKADGHTVIVFHRTYDGKLCPVEYPLVNVSGRMYIQAEGRILISYSSKTDRLFLSPGGIYIRD